LHSNSKKEKDNIEILEDNNLNNIAFNHRWQNAKQNEQAWQS
jgi:hypothetical protein